MLRRTTAALALGFLASVWVPLGARAAENTKVSGSFDFTVTAACVDPIRVQGSFAEQMHAFFDRDGTPIRVSFTGPVRIVYTNLVTGSTYAPNSSGPGTTDLLTGQTVVRGGNGAIFTAGGVVATDGRILLATDGTPISVIHHETGICGPLGTTAA